MIKYRIVYRNKFFYPHIGKKFLFWFRWQRIGQHNNNSFGLYDANDYSHGKSSQEEAQDVINRYHKWNLHERFPEMVIIENVKPEIYS